MSVEVNFNNGWGSSSSWLQCSVPSQGTRGVAVGMGAEATAFMVGTASVVGTASMVGTASTAGTVGEA